MAITTFPIFKLLIQPAYEIQILENKLENKKLELKNDLINSSIDSLEKVRMNIINQTNGQIRNIQAAINNYFTY